MKRLLILMLLSATPVYAQSPMQTLSTERQMVGTPMTAAETARILNATAVKHGLFLLSKPSGNNCPLPGTGEPISCDYLVRPDGGGFDVLSDQEGAGRVVGPAGEPNEFFPSERMIKPFAGVTPSPSPSQPPVVVASPTDLSPIKAWLDAAELRLTTVVTAEADRSYAQVERVNAHGDVQHAETVSLIKDVKEKPSAMTEVFGNRYVQIALAVIGALATNQAVR